jgi:cysteine-S-conjugate beta-lyase
MNPADLAAKLSSRTKLVWLEAAGSVTMEFPDVAALSHLCRERGVTTALDNTWGAGLAFNAFDYVDITIHALTKYPSGSANLLMGSVVTQSEALYQKIRFSHMHLGWGVGANDVEQVLLGLNTLELRYTAQDQAARTLAAYLGTCPEIAQVLHPAMEGALGHEAWRRICTGNDGVTRAAGIFSVIFQSEFTQAAVDRFCEALFLFKLGYSWAGPMSLVVPYDLRVIRPNGSLGIPSGCLVRFCIGLENTIDLQADLAQALRTLHVSDLQ